MKITAYSLVLAGVFAVLPAFATTAALAEMKSEQKMEQSGVTEIQKLKKTGETGFSGEAKSGVIQQKKTLHTTEKETGMKGKTPADVSREGMGKSEKAATGAEMKGPMKGGEKSEVSSERKSGGIGGTEGRTMGEPGKKSEAPIPGERGKMVRGVRGGVAVVSSVDRPDNCLRIRSGPGASHNVVACAATGKRLQLTGEFSSDGRWARVDDGGWVFFRQLDTDVRPPQSVASGGSFDQPATAGKGVSKKGYKRFHRYGGTHCYYGTGYYPYYHGWGYYGWFPGYHYGYRGGSWYP